MSIHNTHPTLPNWNIVKIALTALLLSSYLAYAASASSSEKITRKDKFVITGSEFHQWGQFDAGEIRVFLKNTSKAPMSIGHLKLSRLIDGKSGEQSEIEREINYLYSKLSPPVLMPGQDGELLVKLLKAPPDNSKLKCTIYDSAGTALHSSVLVEQARIWIPYIGFSEDLSKVYVYVRNNTQKPLKLQLIKVVGINVDDNYHSINNNLPPNDKGCLVFTMPTPLVFGEYVHVVILAKSDDQEWQTSRIVRAVNKFPMLFESGSGDPKLGLDSKNFSVQTMICPAHAHGTHENAARKFLDDRYRRFSQDPYLLTQMWICRSGKPRAYYKFGPLPDVAVINPVLFVPQTYKVYTKTSERFHPFFWLATMAKEATAPNRYLACIPLSPEDSVFLQDSHTSEEIRFLAYCAIASEARGILYRGRPASDPLGRDSFIRLNKELQQLKPLLMIAEPVNWASAADSNCTAKSLLCGDEAVLVMVFDRRYFGEQKNNRLYTPAFQKKVNPVKVKITIPEGFRICELGSIYKPLSNKLWSCRDNQLDFTAHIVDSVQVYKAALIRQGSIPNAAGIAQ